VSQEPLPPPISEGNTDEWVTVMIIEKYNVFEWSVWTVERKKKKENTNEL
jgi:hypothetical protein